VNPWNITVSRAVTARRRARKRAMEVATAYRRLIVVVWGTNKATRQADTYGRRKTSRGHAVWFCTTAKQPAGA
jgi:hypothetical protein